jgi:translocator protein
MIRLLALITLLSSNASFAAAFQPPTRVAVTASTVVSHQRLPPSPLVGQERALSSKHTGVLLHSTTDDSSSSAAGTLDGSAILKYGAAMGVQMGLVFAIFGIFDKLVAAYSLKIPFAANVVLFYFLALKSRVLNPLSNTRPQTKTLEAADGDNNKNDVPKRNMPSWTPPGVVFPIVWLLIIGPIRAVTSAMVYKSVGSYASLPILSLMLHLSIGDVWNTINNVERRYGVAVTGVFCVWLSKAHAAYQYGLVNCLAGTLLGGTLIWLTIASALVTATWRLNPNPTTNKPEPLYPVKGKTETKFAWFSGTKK